MESNHELSIIVPVFNVSEYLGKCIDSLVAQYNSRFSILLIDDGSFDSSGSICDKYAEDFDFIFAFHKENGGLSSARNFGLEQVKSEYVLFVDGDDWVAAGLIKDVFRVIDKEKPDIILFNYARVYPQKAYEVILFGESETKWLFESPSKNSLLRRLVGPFLDDEVRDVAKMESLVSSCTKVFKYGVIRGLRFVDNKQTGTGEDLIFNLQAFCRAQSFSYLPAAYYRYRKARTGSITNTFSSSLLEKWSFLYSLIEPYSRFGPDFEKAFLNRRAIAFLSFGLYIVHSSAPRKEKKRLIACSLNHPLFSEALERFSPHPLSLPYRTFFRQCQRKHTSLVYLGLTLADFLRGRFL